MVISLKRMIPSQVSWSVRESDFRSQVVAPEGIITFGSGVREQDLVIRLINDGVSTLAVPIFVIFIKNEDEQT